MLRPAPTTRRTCPGRRGAAGSRWNHRDRARSACGAARGRGLGMHDYSRHRGQPPLAQQHRRYPQQSANAEQPLSAPPRHNAQPPATPPKSPSPGANALGSRSACERPDQNTLAVSTATSMLDSKEIYHFPVRRTSCRRLPVRPAGGGVVGRDGFPSRRLLARRGAQGRSRMAVGHRVAAHAKGVRP